MKKKATLALAIAGVLLFMQSCAASSVTTLPEPPSEDKPGRAGSNSSYVILKDGSIQQYSTLKLVTGLFTSPHLLADGKTEILANSIFAYQNETHYALSPENLVNGRRSKSAVEALPGFAVRIATGKLNVYSHKYFNGSGTSEELFIQIGNEGAVMAFKPELMNDILKDHPEAFDFFHSRNKKAPVSKKLIATAELFNRQPLLSRN